MRKYLFIILSLIGMLPLQARDNATQLLQKTVSKLKQDGALSITIEAQTRDENGTDIIDLELRMDGTSFCVKEDDNMMWFDGKTLWRGNDYGSGIEEIYITEPTAQERARYDIIGLLERHKGFEVSGNGKDTFTLTASNQERSIEGINSVTVQVDPSTFTIRTVSVVFAQELGGITATAKVKSYIPARSFDKKTFICPVQEYKDAEIIDLR